MRPRCPTRGVFQNLLWKGRLRNALSPANTPPGSPLPDDSDDSGDGGDAGDSGGSGESDSPPPAKRSRSANGDEAESSDDEPHNSRDRGPRRRRR